MTNFIDRLTKEEMGDLLDEFGFQPYSDSFRKGTHCYSEAGYKVYHTWNHDYISSKDYDDEYIYISDFDVKYCWGDKAENNKTLYSFMFNKFGEEWADKAIKYLTYKKATNKVAFVQSLIENAKVETPNL